jgi:hypothetical protein
VVARKQRQAVGAVDPRLCGAAARPTSMSRQVGEVVSRWRWRWRRRRMFRYLAQTMVTITDYRTGIRARNATVRVMLTTTNMRL